MACSRTRASCSRAPRVSMSTSQAEATPKRSIIGRRLRIVSTRYRVPAGPGAGSAFQRTINDGSESPRRPKDTPGLRPEIQGDARSSERLAEPFQGFLDEGDARHRAGHRQVDLEDRHEPPRPDELQELSKRGRGIREVQKDETPDDAVERLCRTILLQVRHLKLDLAEAGIRSGPRGRDGVRGAVDASTSPKADERGREQADIAGPAAQIEDAQPGPIPARWSSSSVASPQYCACSARRSISLRRPSTSRFGPHRHPLVTAETASLRVGSVPARQTTDLTSGPRRRTPRAWSCPCTPAPGGCRSSTCNRRGPSPASPT